MSASRGKAAPVVKHIGSIKEITAGDRCRLREIFHPDRDPVQMGYSLAFAYVEPGGSTANHVLQQSEVYYVLSGHATMFLDERGHDVSEGSAYYVPSGVSQYLINRGQQRFQFLCIVDPPWTAGGETVVQTGKS